MDYFGETSSVHMPRHFFWECLHLDHDSAVRADVTRQNYSVCPRHWYVDAAFKCSRCSENFVFSAAEQKLWYEELGFYVDSYAKNCPSCRRDKRKTKSLRQNYDRDIESTLRSQDLAAKQLMTEIIDELCSLEADMPEKIHANRKTLGKQIDRLTRHNDE